MKRGQNRRKRCGAAWMRRCLGAALAAGLLLGTAAPVQAADPDLEPMHRVWCDALALARAREAVAERFNARTETVKTGPLYDNISTVAYRHQLWHTCKATSCTIAVNLLLGRDEWTTTAMGGDECINISWLTFDGSDGKQYRGVYCFDEEERSRGELIATIESALRRGIPIVAGIHSTRPGYTRHHWVLVVGKLGDDYLIVDPSWGEGGTVLEHVVPMSVLHYAFGLTDYSRPHYVYMTFEPVEDAAE